MEYMNDYAFFASLISLGAFLTNIIVQLTKGIVPIPTKLWCIIVSLCLCLSSFFAFYPLKTGPRPGAKQKREGREKGRRCVAYPCRGRDGEFSFLSCNPSVFVL